MQNLLGKILVGVVTLKIFVSIRKIVPNKHERSSREIFIMLIMEIKFHNCYCTQSRKEQYISIWRSQHIWVKNMNDSDSRLDIRNISLIFVLLENCKKLSIYVST